MDRASEVVMQHLRVLIVEDSADDVELVLRTLRKAGYRIEHRCVDTAQDMAAALMEQDWDLVTSDHNMPTFSSCAALADCVAIARRTCLSGT